MITRPHDILNAQRRTACQMGHTSTFYDGNSIVFAKTASPRAVRPSHVMSQRDIMALDTGAIASALESRQIRADAPHRS
jgi:hypothetical protein